MTDLLEVMGSVDDPNRPVTVPAYVLADLVMAVMVKAGRRQVAGSIDVARKALLAHHNQDGGSQ